MTCLAKSVKADAHNSHVQLESRGPSTAKVTGNAVGGAFNNPSSTGESGDVSTCPMVSFVGGMNEA